MLLSQIHISHQDFQSKSLGKNEFFVKRGYPTSFQILRF